MSKNLWELHHEASQSAQQAAEEKLRRPLTQAERLEIWTQPSVFAVSSILMAITAAETAAELEQYLAGLPTPEFVPE
jgi:hypothetical protein